jgi:hypothetical protein
MCSLLGVNHIDAKAAISLSAGTDLYFQICYIFLVGYLDVIGLLERHPCPPCPLM